MSSTGDFPTQTACFIRLIVRFSECEEGTYQTVLAADPPGPDLDILMQSILSEQVALLGCSFTLQQYISVMIPESVFFIRIFGLTEVSLKLCISL